MNSERRLAEIVAALQEAGIVCLVGLARHTNDFDLHLAPDCWGDLTVRLAASELAKAGALQ